MHESVETMNDSLRQAVVEVLNYLLALQREGVRPDDARTRLQAVRGHHPELAIDLLAQEEAYDQSVHYDALIRRAGEGIISLSYCPERAVPWPMRGVHRINETDLVRVNGQVLTVDQAIACIDFIWDEAPIIEGLVNACLIQEELQRDPIAVADAELQAAMDKFRSAKRLFKAEDTLCWLERHGMSHEKLECYVADNAVVAKLRDRIAADRVEEYFRQHSGDFDTAWIARLEVTDESEAHELAEQIRAGRQEFFAAAARCYVDSARLAKPPAAALFAEIERREAAATLREHLFAAAPGQLVGPVTVESGQALLRVLEIVPARLDDRTRAAIKHILFEGWLAERRKAAQIEWCWGNISKTG
jgi:putative peptide maturation system protein